MANKYVKTRIRNDAEAKALMLKPLTRIHNSTKDLNTRIAGLSIQALSKDKNIKGLVGRPEIHKIDSLNQVGASNREILQYMIDTGVGMNGVNTKIINPAFLLDKDITNRMRNLYKSLRSKGLNHSSASAFMSLIQGETTSDNKDDLFNYAKIRYNNEKGLNRVIDGGLLSFVNLRRPRNAKEIATGFKWIEDPNYNWGAYQKYLKNNKLKDSNDTQLDWYIANQLPKNAIETLNAMSAEDAATWLFEKQRTGKSSDSNNIKTLRDRASFYNKTEFDFGGLIPTMKGRRYYDLGGSRDSVNNVTGSSWSAERGIQGAKTKSGLATGMGIGAVVGGTVGSVVPVIGTAIGTIAGSVIGGIGGAIGGLFTGRKKKRKAREAAIRADITKNYELGQDDIRLDQEELNNTYINDNPIDLYGDNPIIENNTQSINNLFPTYNNLNSYDMIFKCGGKRKRYDAGGSINQVASNAAIVEGPKHEQGGVPYGMNAEVEGGEAILNGTNADYIFSDSLKLDNRTFADIAKPLMLHKGYLENKLAVSSTLLGGLLKLTDRSNYAIDRNTNARNAEKQSVRHNKLLNEIALVQSKLNDLYNTQEAMKASIGETAEPKEEFDTGGPILHNTSLDTSLAPMNTTLSTPLVDGNVSNINIANVGALGLNTIANLMAKNAINKRTNIVAGLPDHIRTAVLQEVGMRNGGKCKKADGGVVQISPFVDLNIQSDNPTKQMVNPKFYQTIPIQIKKPGGKIVDKINNSTFIEDEGGNMIGALGNLIGNLMTSKGKRRLAKSISNMPLPKRQKLNNINLEWDINTDAQRREVIDQLSATEDFISSNTSSAPIARQAILMARSKGSSVLGKLKQEELLNELNIRNQARQINAEINAKNKQIQYENDKDASERSILASTLLNEGDSGILNAIVELTGNIQQMYNDNKLINAQRANNLLTLRSLDKSLGFLNNLSDSQIRKLFGKDAIALKSVKRYGGKIKRKTA